MRIAVISDVHANLPALEAVLADAANQHVEGIWNLGDFVGYGPWPEEVVRRLRRSHALHLRGNYDRKVLSFPDNRKKWRKKKDPRKFLAFQYAYEGLSIASRDFLASLPSELRLPCRGREVLLTHGSPASDSEALTSDTSVGHLASLAERAEADVVCCGHSHEPFVREAGGTLFINPGSVGRPEGSDPRTVYALVEFGESELVVRHRRLEYDVLRTVRHLRQAGMPEDFARMLTKGCNLDELLDDRPAAAADGTSEPPTGQTLLEAARRLAARFGGDDDHAEQVARLAVQLFEATASLHGYGAIERAWLHAAALLHDIGWVEGQKAHHKTSRRLIAQAEELPLRPVERQIVAGIARYHRKALPKARHEHYASLGAADQTRVGVLGGLLRLADGLDRSHLSDVVSVQCQADDDVLVVHCLTRGPAALEQQAAQKKSDLLARALRRAIRVEMTPAEPQAPATSKPRTHET